MRPGRAGIRHARQGRVALQHRRGFAGKRPKGFETQELFELSDAWGNPLAYIHHLEYERVFTYRAVDTENGEENDYEVKARKTRRPSLGRAARVPASLGGSDGKFGTEDDLTNYKK